jgi:MAF protein
MRLHLPFETAVPDVDETRRMGEAAQDLVVRLAETKARAVAPSHPAALIIGSDQVACLGSTILGKPGDRETAIAQLQQASGQCVTFLTGLCLLEGEHGPCRVLCEPFRVHFRALTRAQIEAYVDRERPFNSAGSIRSEGLGVALFERLEGDDPAALIGLPLIRLTQLLQEAGVDVLAA